MGCLSVLSKIDARAHDCLSQEEGATLTIQTRQSSFAQGRQLGNM